MKVTVREVLSAKELKQFVHFPNWLYKDNPYYVPQIESIDRATLDPARNHAFEVCEARYWIAYDECGNPVGRIAGIINHAYNKKVGKPICRFGWLDFVEDKDVLGALLSTVEDYARSNGLSIMNGPVGFLEFDVSGILVEGFTEIPTPYGKYNAPYYDPMIKEFGYAKDTDWVEYVIDIRGFDYDRLHRAASLVENKYHLRQAPITKRRHLKQYLNGIFDVMNRCYGKLHGYSDLTPGQTEDLKNQFFPFADPDLTSVVLDSSDKVVGFIFWMPSLSKAMMKARGSLFPFGWLHILGALKHNDTVNSLLIAVDPEYQNKGMVSMFFDKIATGVRKIGIRYIETTRQLEDNHNVLNLSIRMDRHFSKRARCYIKTDF